MQFPNMLTIQGKDVLGTGQLGAYVFVPLSRRDLKAAKTVLDDLLQRNSAHARTSTWRKLSQLRARINVIDLAVSNTVNVSFPKTDVIDIIT